MIPQCDLRAAYEADKPEIDEAIARVAASGWYVLGSEVEAFEAEFAAWIGARHAVGVANGTDAIALALKAVGVSAGDCVVAPSFTVSATVAAIEQIGARPILVDVDPVTWTMNVDDVRDVLEDHPVRAVLPVHLFGHPADVASLLQLCRDAGAALVDDCAHAFGAMVGDARIGSIGDASAFSFYPTKNLGCFGDGGMVTTNSPQTAKSLRSYRQYCWGKRYVSEASGGVDSRLDELQAAILRVRLRKLDARQARRREIAAKYDVVLGTFHWPRHANHLYVVRFPRRDAFIAHLASNGISTNVHYPVPCHLQPAWKNSVALGPRKCETSERLAREVVTLPLYPEMTDEQVERVCEALRAWS